MIRTVSLETAKKLKETGFGQKTLFCHIYSKRCGGEWEVMLSDAALHLGSAWDWDSRIAAPTTDELLEALPIGSDKWTGHYRHLALWPHAVNNWQCAYVLPVGDGYFGWQESESPAEALASMWLLLKKDGLI